MESNWYFNDVYLQLLDDTARHQVVYGGAGSGKSEDIAKEKLLRILKEDNMNAAFSRKVAKTIRGSQFALFKSIIKRYDMGSLFTIRESSMEIEVKDNGNKLLAVGVDDEEKIKSITNIRDWWLEEATEFEEDDIKQINLRLRGEIPTYYQITYTFNPIDEEHHLRKRFFGDRNIPLGELFKYDNVSILRTNYKHNHFLDDEYRAELEKMEKEDEYYYRVYTLGEWASIQVVGRVYKKFTQKNILPKADFKYNEGLPLIVCVDFNVNPMKWAVVQKHQGIDYVFDEIVMNDTDTETMAKEVLSRYGNRIYEFYGDYSGTFRSTNSRTTDYQIIKQIIPSANINIKPNPSVIDRINSFNWRLCNDTGTIRMYITDNCTHTIKDLNRVQWREGRREIDKTNFELTHISDAIGYYTEYEYSLKGKPTVIQGRQD